MTAWKDFERRAARMLGGERSGPLGKHGSDATGTPVALECKRTTRYSLRRAWVEQARRQSRQEGRPWVLAISEHNDRAPIAVVDFQWLCELLIANGDFFAAVSTTDDCPQSSPEVSPSASVEDVA